jgi:hypothetical protein
MAVTRFPSGAKAHTFPPPPPGFDPLKADDESLLRHGLPRRPTGKPELLKLWERAMSRKMHYVEAVFEPVPDVRHGLRIRATSEGTLTSYNWSGGILFSGANSSFKWVTGEWTVPNPKAPVADGTWYYSSAWVGIDGDPPGSNDVFQAGTEADALSSGGTTQQNIYAWWEWFPEGSMKIKSIPVAAGDDVTVMMCEETNTSGYVFFTNNTTGASTSFQITAPSGTTLVGNCAEWIVEAPTVNNQQAKLANYGEVNLLNCTAEYINGGAALQSGSGDNINMVDGNNKVISKATLVGPTTVKCDYV